MTDLNEIRLHACDGKKRYTAKGARAFAARSRDHGDPLTAYRCVQCHHWHCGHAMSWKKLKRLAKALRANAYPEGPHIERAS